MKNIFIISAIIFITTAFLYSASRFTDNGDGTVTDSVTLLIWQKCTRGLSGTDCSSISATTTSTRWEAAITYCEGLSLGGRSDWRLPNINELKSIIDYGSYDPAINITYFPSTFSSYYWSSTTFGSYYSAWLVGFYRGSVDYDKSSWYLVRCVAGP